MVTSASAIGVLNQNFSTAGLPALGVANFNIVIGSTRFSVSITGETAVFGPPAEHPDFVFTVSAEAWGRYTEEPPPRGYTTAQAMSAATERDAVRGNQVTWAVNARIVDRIFEVLRQAEAPRPPRHDDPVLRPGRSSIEGGYVTVSIEGQLRRIYVEWGGSGSRTLLCLHTAGADSRQFRYLLEDEELGQRYRIAAFDMPWHGRSDPPADWMRQTYRLTTETYAATVLAVMEALELDRPVLLGCSMGGAIALYMAATYGDRLSASLALEGGLGNPGRFVPWTNHLSVDHSHFLTSWVGGLIAPSSPKLPLAQTLWGYAQSGPGVYQGDTYFYSVDFPRHASSLGRARCPLWVFSGEYDYSATTEMSREAAQRLGGTPVEMPGVGHFPMSEDPAAFRHYLVPVLDQVETTVSA